MRHAGRTSRVEAVEIDREIDRRLEIELQILAEMPRLDHFDAEALELVTKFIIEGAQADLDQPVGQSLLQDAREGRGVGPPVALIGIVDVGMGVDLDDR
ncbi:hypothetical protein X755_26025 [Mesorhizobium sp. LNJC405B00]|nr:hypothetical protein X755_26025 [Mesorhizobium sp. LNJC405B00]